VANLDQRQVSLVTVPNENERTELFGQFHSRGEPQSIEDDQQ
jgi:hypothetical protein